MKAILKQQPVEVFFYDGSNAAGLAHFLNGDVCDINSYDGKRHHKVWIIYGDNKTLYVHLDVDENQAAVIFDGRNAETFDMGTFEMRYEVIDHE